MKGCKTRMDDLLVKLVELDSLLSRCLFNPSLVTEAKLFLQVINFAFLIFQVSDKIMDSDLQQQLSFPTAAKIRACVSYCVPLNPIFHPPVLCFSDRPARMTASPSSVLGRDKWMFVSPLDPVVMSPTGEATRKLIILSSEWDFYCK